MTRKDFQLIADTIKSNFAGLSDKDKEALARVFALSLAQTNPLFNKEKFIAACK